LDTSTYNTRTRGIISFDSRSQTEWGTLRAYIRAGWEMQSDTSELGAEGDYRGRRYFDRAFIQFAGLTVGKTQSFFDFYADALNYTTTIINGSDTGHGINLIAYTATFGGGFSATVSLEENTHRRVNMYDASTAAIAPGASPGAGPPLSGSRTSLVTFVSISLGVRPRSWVRSTTRRPLATARFASTLSVATMTPRMRPVSPSVLA
jgi:hypothetical protein